MEAAPRSPSTVAARASSRSGGAHHPRRPPRRPDGGRFSAERTGRAKNSVLKLMAAAIMAEGSYALTNVPDIVDVRIMSDLLAALGLQVELVPADGLDDGGVPGPASLRIVRPPDVRTEAPYELVER